jgi:hypothetical protein
MSISRSAPPLAFGFYSLPPLAATSSSFSLFPVRAQGQKLHGRRAPFHGALTSSLFFFLRQAGQPPFLCHFPTSSSELAVTHGQLHSSKLAAPSQGQRPSPAQPFPSPSSSTLRAPSLPWLVLVAAVARSDASSSLCCTLSRQGGSSPCRAPCSPAPGARTPPPSALLPLSSGGGCSRRSSMALPPCSMVFGPTFFPLGAPLCRPAPLPQPAAALRSPLQQPSLALSSTPQHRHCPFLRAVQIPATSLAEHCPAAACSFASRVGCSTNRRSEPCPPASFRSPVRDDAFVFTPHVQQPRPRFDMVSRCVILC